MKRDDPAANADLLDEPPVAVPIFRTWRRAYALAIGLFAVEIALLYVFTRYFS